MDLFMDFTGGDSDAVDDESLDSRYSTAITGWMVVHGAVAMDMTLTQLGRFRAWEAAYGDVDAARALVACRELMRRRAR